MCRKQNKNIIIIMPKFLYEYFGVTDLNIFEMTHDDVKVLFPELKRSSFEEIQKDYTCIYNGNVILVRDKKGDIIPYYNPLRYLEMEFECLEKIERPKKIKQQNNIDIEELSNYQLKEEYKKEKKLHQYSLCRILKREISSRKLEQHGCKKKILEKYKGEINYD